MSPTILLKSLIRREAPEESLVGIVLAAVFARNYAVARSREEKSGSRDKQWRANGGFQTDRAVHVFVGHPAWRTSAKHLAWLVVGRSGGGAYHGPNHREGRYRSTAR